MSFASPRPFLAKSAWAVPWRPAPAAPHAWNTFGQAGPSASAPPGLRLLPAAGFAWSGPRGLPHTRSDHVLIWLTAGSAALRLPRAERPAPGLLFLPAGTAFALEPATDADGLVLLLSRDLASRASHPFPAGIVEAAPGPSDGKALQAAMTALSAEAQHHGLDTSPQLEEWLGQVALRLSRLAARCRLASPARDPLVQGFLVLAPRELPRGRSVEDIAAMLGCTAEALDRACMAQHGKPALDLFASVRIGRAVDLLAGTDRTLAEIARETGFSTCAHLSRAVLAATGTPPEALRPRQGASPSPQSAASSA